LGLSLGVVAGCGTLGAAVGELAIEPLVEMDPERVVVAGYGMDGEPCMGPE
jgi:hypothetical protein